MAKKRILHVDNDEETLKVVKKILELKGFEVDSVISGMEALNKVDKGGYDLVLMDVMMPSLSGWDTFIRLKKIKKEQDVAFLSVMDISKERQKKLKKEGVKDYILKPFNNKELVNRLDKIIGKG